MNIWKMIIAQVVRHARGVPQYKGSQGKQSGERMPRYHPERNEAYCKYCYQTHRLWQRFWDVFPGEIVWECEICTHRTRDEYMHIEGIESSPEQKAFYRP